MTRDQLEHIIRASAVIADDDEVIIRLRLRDSSERFGLKHRTRLIADALEFAGRCAAVLERASARHKVDEPNHAVAPPD